MKVIVTAEGQDIDARVDARFGRARYFIIVDTETMEFEAVENAAQYQGGGAGVQSAQFVVDKDVHTVITGNCGPNSYDILRSASIDVIVGARGTVREAVKMFKTGKFKPKEGPNVGSHFGMH